MRSLLAVLLLTLPATAGPSFLKKSATSDYALLTGDIVFQATGGHQCEAIRAATHSKYSHCGVVFRTEGRLYVLEAVSPDVSTPLATFKKRSLPGTFHARRLKNAEQAITPATLEKALAWTKSNLGKAYDVKFLWSDRELYCSELVWKVYRHSADIELAQPRRFDSYDLTPRSVQNLITHRFGSREHFPEAEPVVAPSDLATSPLLAEVPRQQRKK